MSSWLANSGWILAGAAAGAGLSVAVAQWRARRLRGGTARDVLRWHFWPTSLEKLVVTQRTFPHRVRADLQRAIERELETAAIRHFCGVQAEFSPLGINLAQCLTTAEANPARVVAPQFEEVDIGDDVTVRCAKSGLWCVTAAGHPCAILLDVVPPMFGPAGLRIDIATRATEPATRYAEELFTRLEAAVARCESYRGKVLSLAPETHDYSGKAAGIRVHRLHAVERQQVILPPQTLELLDRNVIQFVRQRPRLARFRQARKKGLLFYGPPGTGKTHTIHYLAKALEGHTTLLITAEEVAKLEEYMTLARLLQPSVVVVEDVDLIARERTDMRSACEEVALNQLLNEMDGLKEDVDVLFILTTNRPEVLEPALAARPGRIDQAIEFPLPDEVGREKLVRLYAPDIALADDLVATIVRRTERVSAAFIKELMRRTVQFHLERSGDGQIDQRDVDGALDEILFRGGTLNLTLLGADKTVPGRGKCGF